METSLYEQIGGKEALNLAVNLFYDKIVKDPVISYFFEKIDMEEQLKKQKKFLAYVLGASETYDGKSLRDAHKELVNEGLNKTHFDHVIMHLKDSLSELGVDNVLIEKIINIAKSTEPDVLDKNYKS